MVLSARESLLLKDPPNDFIFKTDHLEKQLRAIDLKPFLVATVRDRLFIVFEMNKFTCVLVFFVVETRCRVASL